MNIKKIITLVAGITLAIGSLPTPLQAMQINSEVTRCSTCGNIPLNLSSSYMAYYTFQMGNRCKACGSVLNIPINTTNVANTVSEDEKNKRIEEIEAKLIKLEAQIRELTLFNAHEAQNKQESIQTERALWLVGSTSALLAYKYKRSLYKSALIGLGSAIAFYAVGKIAFHYAKKQ